MSFSTAAMSALWASCPWVGVGIVTLLSGHAVGIGVQPSFVIGAVLLVSVASVRPRLDADAWAVVAALVWTAISVTGLWTLDHLGQSGEAPYLKGAKQLLVLVFLVGFAVLPVVQLRRVNDPRRELARWETGVSVGLLLACTAALVQAIQFYVQSDALQRGLQWMSSNPSIASGSDELYLGHRFVGIPRVRGPACEPLYFGSYLLMAVPVAVAGALGRRRWARAWRLLAAGAGVICLVMTFSRGVYLAAAVLVAALAWGARRGRWHWRATRRDWFLGGAGLGLVMLALAPLVGMAPWDLPDLVLRRLAQSFATHDMSNLTRLMAWRGAWRAFELRPVQGIGWGGYGFWYYRLVPDGAGAHFGWPVTNNVALRVLAETGLVGLVLWSLALRPALRPLWRHAMSTYGDGVSFFLACIVLAMGVQTLTFSQLQLPHLWLAVGASAAVAREAHRLV
jgi:O-antigen ligase